MKLFKRREINYTPIQEWKCRVEYMLEHHKGRIHRGLWSIIGILSITVLIQLYILNK